jgi:hypothetical protein
METNVYLGLEAYGTSGLLNNPNVTRQPVATGGSGGTEWLGKTPDEILTDINAAILAGWEAAEHDLSAIPNHILLPYAQYTYIQTTKVSPIAEKTIMTFLLENNIATLNGSNLEIGATSFCKGAGAGGTDRMAAYVNNDRFSCYGESAYEFGRTIRDGLYGAKARGMFHEQKFHLVPETPQLIQTRELVDSSWVQRCDFTAVFLFLREDRAP